ncbi:MAG: hypothetical protein CMJ78_18165 [Planctomycetaceae bacterium]|nr:hypothetical protein [Planctomycetaceae bacterium]
MAQFGLQAATRLHSTNIAIAQINVAESPSAKMEEQEFKYWGFISYSDRDSRWGDWLHRKLETYKVPSQLRRERTDSEKLPARMFPVFREPRFHTEPRKPRNTRKPSPHWPVAS